MVVVATEQGDALLLEEYDGSEWVDERDQLDSRASVVSMSARALSADLSGNESDPVEACCHIEVRSSVLGCVSIPGGGTLPGGGLALGVLFALGRRDTKRG